MRVTKETIGGLAKTVLELMETTNSLPPKGTPISLSEASRKYGIAFSTLQGWANRGILPTLQMPLAGGGVRLMDEHYIAKAVRLYRSAGGRAGVHISEKLLKPYLTADTD